MPRIEVEEGHQEVEAQGGAGGDDEIGEHVVAERQGCLGVLQLGDDDIQRREGGIGHNDRVDDKTRHEHLLRPATIVSYPKPAPKQASMGPLTPEDDSPWRE